MIQEKSSSEQMSSEQKDTSSKLKSQNTYWSQHRITLIAYETKYIREKKMEEKEPFQFQLFSQATLKKYNRQKVDLKFQSGFLLFFPQKSLDFQVKQLVKEYRNLNWLFNFPNNKDISALRDFIRHLIELKHSSIVKQFCLIYSSLIPQIIEIKKDMIVNEKQRFELIQAINGKLLNYIQKNSELFPWFTKFLSQDQIATKKLLLVQVYCLIAEKINFTINEFYDETFSHDHVEKKPSKKVKQSKQ